MLLLCTLEMAVVAASRIWAKWVAIGPVQFRREASDAVRKVSAVVDTSTASSAALWLECRKRALIWQQERELEEVTLKLVAVRHREDVLGPLFAVFDSVPPLVFLPGLVLGYPLFSLLPPASATIAAVATSTAGALFCTNRCGRRVQQLCADNVAMWQTVAHDVAHALGTPLILKGGPMDSEWETALQHFAELTGKEGEQKVTADTEAVVLAAATMLSWDASLYAYHVTSDPTRLVRPT